MAGNEEFKGVIKTSILDSTPWWPEKPHAPESAPNILYIVLDDTGYSHLSCYGGLVPTPNMDAIDLASTFHRAPGWQFLSGKTWQSMKRLT